MRDLWLHRDLEYFPDAFVTDVPAAPLWAWPTRWRGSAPEEAAVSTDLCFILRRGA